MRPEMTPSFNAGDSKLGEEELHILMAHAYWKILTLQKEMAKQQVSVHSPIHHLLSNTNPTQMK